ncbi:NUDIX domain-containing protein [Patescibacteria group bacterium]
MVKKLSREDFLRSLELSPRLTVELLVENPQGKLLLLKREDPPFKGHWHLPGGFLIKDETFRECISRLSKEELGINFTSVYAEKLGLFETIGEDPRGHILHYAVKLEPSNLPKGRFFNKIPKKTIHYQKKFLIELGYIEEKQ